VLDYLIGLNNQASLSRVIMGMAVLLDPRNKIIDPNSDTLERYQEPIAAPDTIGGTPNS
jgi:hypothetical protein